MNKELLRNEAARMLYDADINLNENTSVKELIDLLIRFGAYTAEFGFIEGKVSTLAPISKDEFLKKYFDKV